jgi:hypothetical protein
MNTNKIDTPTLILIMILMMALINGMMSCTSTKVVYQVKNGWSKMPTRSTSTGWVYDGK